MLAHRGAHPNYHFKPAQAGNQHFLQQRTHTGFSRNNSKRRFPEKETFLPKIQGVDIMTFNMKCALCFNYLYGS